jgi:hypothetical protein
MVRGLFEGAMAILIHPLSALKQYAIHQTFSVSCQLVKIWSLICLKSARGWIYTKSLNQNPLENYDATKDRTHL